MNSRRENLKKKTFENYIDLTSQFSVEQKADMPDQAQRYWQWQSLNGSSPKTTTALFSS